MSEVIEMDFDVLSEPWNVYQLEEGPILKIKYVLTRVLKRRENGGRFGYAIKGQNVVVFSHIPPELKGEPTHAFYSPMELQASIVKDGVRYATLAEEWNEYLAEDGTSIRVKLTVVKVSRTNKKDMDGDPVYLVQTSLLPQIQPPKR
ncbi:MAG: hypothetical protein QW261_04355 [Candidatus Jordarchaeaceae archaeon]